MRALHLTLFQAALAGFLLALDRGVTGAKGQVFTLDTNRGSVTISGTVLGGVITNQAPGSLTTTIEGKINASVTGNTITFTGQSQILAQTNGSWQPAADGTAGSAPADFGGQATLSFASGAAALRNVQLDVTSPGITLSGGQFDSTMLVFVFPSNALSSLAYNVVGLISKHGTLALTGYATNKVAAMSSLGTVGGEETLTIPVDATFYLKLLTANDTVIRLQGQLVAVQSSQAPLQVQSVTVQNQSLLLQWQASPGQQFQVQSSVNLTGWTNAATITTPASGMNTWTGTVVGPLGFYRLAK